MLTRSLFLLDTEFATHQADESLEAYLVGTLRPEECRQLEEHILWCRPCQMRLEETEAYVDLIRTALLQMQI